MENEITITENNSETKVKKRIVTFVFSLIFTVISLLFVMIALFIIGPQISNTDGTFSGAMAVIVSVLVAVLAFLAASASSVFGVVFSSISIGSQIKPIKYISIGTLVYNISAIVVGVVLLLILQ